MEKLYIVGFGPGCESLWTQEAKNIMELRARILSTARISEKGKTFNRCTLSQIMEELQKTISGVTVVLVSGDCNFFSICKTISKVFSDMYDIKLISGSTSIQYFSSKILVPYDDAKVISMHGRDGRIVSKVCYNKKVFALTGGEYKAHNICNLLYECGLGGVTVYIGENLSYENERIVKGTALDLKEQLFSDLSVMYIENDSYKNPHEPIKDDLFIRGNVPMTKEEVRWLSIQKLGIQPYDIVYDVGAGTGSVSIEMARKAYNGLVYAIEKKDEACELIIKNRNIHGAYNLDVIQDKAPDGILNLPIPDKAFIGGSSGNLDSIIKLLKEKNPNIKITANAITSQSVSQILNSFNNYGFKDINTICINVSKSRKVSTYDMMIAQNPVYIITAVGG